MAKYKISEQQFFINPYNFVPVDLKHTERVDVKVQDEYLTGYLECHMKTRTHLAIPDVTNKEETDKPKHYKYPVMGASEGNPYIPGSSVRGVIRNMYETITDSCFGTMKKDTIITSRTKYPFEPGLLIKEEEEWKLYQAKKHVLVVDSATYYKKKLEEKGVNLYSSNQLQGQSGDKVYYKSVVGKNGKTYVKYFATEKSKETNKEGWLCIGEKTSNRHFQSIFEKGEMEEQYSNITEKDLKKLEEVLDIYRNKSINNKYQKEHQGYSEYEKMKKNGVICVYYKVERGKLYMSFATLGRKAFGKTLNDVVGEKSHQKCDSRSNLCPACALFGTVEGEAFGSKVRFTDATCINYGEESIVEDIVFAELSSPKISYLPFYLRGKANVEMPRYQNGYDSPDLEIRGRKFYWHHVPNLATICERNERNATFDVLVPKTEFQFRIYFDKITKHQLDTLVTAIHLGENNLDGDLCHKMGHGKPLGYGSVKMVVKECVLRTFDVDLGWKEVKQNQMCQASVFTCNEKTEEALKTICNFNTCKNWSNIEVEYPSIAVEAGQEQPPAYEWFMENYKVGEKKPKQVLPEIGEDIRLAKFEPLPRNNFGKKENLEKDSTQKVYQAKILSEGRTAKNPKFLEYDVEIINDKSFNGKKCRMSASAFVKLKKDQVVEAELFRGTTFNMKRGKK